MCNLMLRFKPLINLSCLLFVIFIMQSCGPGGPGNWKNSAIPAGKRDAFHELNSQLFAGLKTGDAVKLEYLMAKELIDRPGKARTIEIVSNRFKEGTYDLLDEYYVVNKYNTYDTIKNTSHGINSYTLRYGGSSEEMYMAFFIPKEAIANKYMITAIYCKLNYGWKLTDLDVAPYTIGGKTAPHLYEQARQSYAKHYLLNSYLTLVSASNCSRPSTIWDYEADSAMNAFYGKITGEASASYKFPLTIDQVPTKPKIFNIFNQTLPEGEFPMIYYLSSIKVTDTTAIKQENENIKKVLDQTLPGMDREKKYLLFSAFNERPDGKKTVAHFDMTERLK